MDNEVKNQFVYHTENLWESAITADLDKALVAFAGKLKPVNKDSTVKVTTKTGGAYSYKFASLDETLKVVTPILAECKLCIQQFVTGPGLITIVRHESGQFRAVKIPMVQWEGQGTNAIQNLGGAITYLRRYALGAMLSLATDEDNDSQSANHDFKKNSPAATKKADPNPPPPPSLSENLIDEWQSKVSQCKLPSDFHTLSLEMAKVESDPVKKFVKISMAKRLEEVGVKFDTDAKVFVFVDQTKN
jgi:hypothetical protein